jgi:hypothetical protein
MVYTITHLGISHYFTKTFLLIFQTLRLFIPRRVKGYAEVSKRVNSFCCSRIRIQMISLKVFVLG